MKISSRSWHLRLVRWFHRKIWDMDHGDKSEAWKTVSFRAYKPKSLCPYVGHVILCLVPGTLVVIFFVACILLVSPVLLLGWLCYFIWKKTREHCPLIEVVEE